MVQSQNGDLMKQQGRMFAKKEVKGLTGSDIEQSFWSLYLFLLQRDVT